MRNRVKCSLTDCEFNNGVGLCLYDPDKDIPPYDFCDEERYLDRDKIKPIKPKRQPDKIPPKVLKWREKHLGDD